MLVPAPYQPPEKKAIGGQGGPCGKGTSDVMSEDGTHSSDAEDDDKEEEESGSP